MSSRGVNLVILVGRLGKNPELKSFKGRAVCNFRVATSFWRRDSSGRWVRQPEWHNVIAWNDLAADCSKALEKGFLVYVEGRIVTESWVGADNKTQYIKKIEATIVRSVDERDDDFDSDSWIHLETI